MAIAKVRLRSIEALDAGTTINSTAKRKRFGNEVSKSNQMKKSIFLLDSVFLNCNSQFHF